MSLQSLPAELYIWIARRLPFDDLLALRSCCKTLQHAADDVLQSNVVVHLTKASLFAAKQLARHARFSRNARTVSFYSDRYWPRTDPSNAWERHRYSLSEFCRPLTKSQAVRAISKLIRNIHPTWCDNRVEPWQIAGLMATIQDAKIGSSETFEALQGTDRDPFLLHGPRPLSDHLAKEYLDFPEDVIDYAQMRYVSMQYQQVELLEEYLVFRSFRDLFTNCKALKDVHFITGNGSYEGAVEPAPRHNAFVRGLAEPRGGLACGAGGVAPLTQLILAAADSNFSPQRLRITYGHHLALTEVVRRDKAAWKIFLRDTETLLWVLHTAPVRMDIQSMIFCFDDGSLSNVLGVASNLHDLSLVFPHVENNYKAPLIHISCLFGDVVLPCLTRLSLAYIIVDFEVFPTFLLRHQKTLESLELDRLHIVGGPIGDCLSVFAGRLEKLREVRLRGWWGEESSKSLTCADFQCATDLVNNGHGMLVAEYIITGRGEYPLGISKARSEA